jgi:hypothetical protein
MKRLPRAIIWCWAKMMSYAHILIDKATWAINQVNLSMWKKNLLKTLTFLKRFNGLSHENDNDKAG